MRNATCTSLFLVSELQVDSGSLEGGCSCLACGTEARRRLQPGAERSAQLNERPFPLSLRWHLQSHIQADAICRKALKHRAYNFNYDEA